MNTQEMIEWLDPEQMTYGEDRVMARSIVSVILAAENMRECLGGANMTYLGGEYVACISPNKKQEAIALYDAATGEKT